MWLVKVYILVQGALLRIWGVYVLLFDQVHVLEVTLLR